MAYVEDCAFNNTDIRCLRGLKLVLPINNKEVNNKGILLSNYFSVDADFDVYQNPLTTINEPAHMKMILTA